MMNSNKAKIHNKDVDALCESYSKVVEDQLARLEEEYDVGRDPNMIARIQDATGMTNLTPNNVRAIAAAIQDPSDPNAARTFQQFGIDPELTKGLSDILTPNLQQRGGQAMGRGLRAAGQFAGDVAGVAKKGLQGMGLMQKGERDTDLKRGSLDPHYRDQPDPQQQPDWGEDKTSAPVDQPGVLGSMGQGAFLPSRGDEEGMSAGQTYGHTGGAGGARKGATQAQTNQRQQQTYVGPGGQDQPSRGDVRATPNTPLAQDIDTRARRDARGQR
jgi:hypothetical protein